MAESLLTVEQTQENALQQRASRTYPGFSVFNGVALGQAQIFSEGDFDVPHFSITEAQVKSEKQRLRAAVSSVNKEFEELTETVGEEAPAEAGAFIEMHRQILNDPALFTETQKIIAERLINAEWALAQRLEDVRSAFESIDDPYLSERVEDVEHVVERIQRKLSGRRRPADTLGPMSEDKLILIAKSLNPTDILILKRRRDISVAGIITETGSLTSHTSILARSLEIPTLVGVKDIVEFVDNDDVVLLDADRGQVIVQPDPQSLPEVAERIRALNEAKLEQKKFRTRPAQTSDGIPVELCANIAIPEDAQDAVRVGADGIGLFRSEFLFMNRPSFPSEDEQYENYRRVIRAMKGKPVTIRTMDIGGDKMPSQEALDSLDLGDLTQIENPSLGRRAIRLCMARPELFLTQLRAILRAGCDGTVRILLPMLTRPSEVDITRGFLLRARQQLRKQGIAFAENIAVGGMIETPASALMAPAFLNKLDFISIGTNDLVQYTLAVDRRDPGVADLYDPLHPAVLTLLSYVVKSALKAKKEVSVCGEMAADETMAKILIGMGVRHLSMGSARLLAMKEHIFRIDSKDAKKLADKLRRMSNPASIHDALGLATGAKTASEGK